MADSKSVNISLFENKNILPLIFGNFMESKRNYDIYDSYTLKVITLLIYVSEIFSSILIFAFVYYERSGLAGSYRTFNNQLLAYFYGGVSLFSYHTLAKHSYF